MKRRFENLLTGLLTGLLGLLIPLSLFAGEAAESHPHGEFHSFILKVVNFAVLVFLVWKFSKKPISNALKNRSKAVAEKLEEAKKALEEAEKALMEYQERLKNLEEEMKRIKEKYIEEGKRERDRLIKEASIEVERIKKEAEKIIEDEMKKAEEILKGKGVQIALEMAREILKKNITEKDHKRLIDEFLELVGGRN